LVTEGNDEEILEKISDKLKANINKNSKDVPSHVRVEFIIDLKSISFKKAIQLMEANKNNNITFKFLSVTHDYLIGSDNSNDRGKVILL
jgi:hypothetical protein